jgi:glutamine amidotransferase
MFMIAIIQYNAGNTKSVENAVRRLGYDCIITDSQPDIKAAEKVIFPGVGEASSAMAYLKRKGLDRLIISLEQPVLGICLGLQLMCAFTEEGNTHCLGIFNSTVKKFPPLDVVPHMGWNNLLNPKGSLFTEITDENDVYFIHSYYAEVCQDTIAIGDYILPFSAAMQKNNFYATQFHPEKSAKIGDAILLNFLAL